MGLEWKVSSFCQDGGCVKVRRRGDEIIVQDEMMDEVWYSIEEWRQFVLGVKAGEFDFE